MIHKSSDTNGTMAIEAVTPSFHSIIESDKVDFNDDKFMLVVCSAFINFVEGKAQDGRSPARG